MDKSHTVMTLSGLVATFVFVRRFNGLAAAIQAVAKIAALLQKNTDYDTLWCHGWFWYRWVNSDGKSNHQMHDKGPTRVAPLFVQWQSETWLQETFQ